MLPEKSDLIDDNVRYSSRAITRSLRSLTQVLGQATVDAIEYDFEVYGWPLVNERADYTFAQIRTASEKIFGEAAPLFLERLTRALKRVSE